VTSKDANSWSLPGVLDYFEQQRQNPSDVYPSEALFLDALLVEGISVLDVGCAMGGFAGIIATKLDRFSYTGIDISPAMLERARARHPQHEFVEVGETDFAALGDRRFDLVLCLGILHLNEGWQELLAASWARARRSLLLDLRETHLPTITNRATSYFKMDFGSASDAEHARARLPYNIINTSDALAILHERCPDRARITRYGYTHAIAGSAVGPIQEVMMSTYCIERSHD
jgi:SAM-dependent methyltransferase